MNTFKIFALILILPIFFVACNDDEDKDEDQEVTYEYHAHIDAPSADDKNVNDELAIKVDFESHTGEKIHHINVKIYEVNDPTNIIYNMPTSAHVHADGSYLYEDVFMLSNDNKVNAHTDWILEAKVWGHEAGLQEVAETVQFHVHPE